MTYLQLLKNRSYCITNRVSNVHSYRSKLDEYILYQSRV